MKKSTFIFLLSQFLLPTLFAQNAISFGPQIGIASNFINSSKTGFGVSAEYDNRFSDHLGIRGSLAYTYFKEKYADQYVSFLPFRVGVQGYLVPDLFVLGEAGAAIYGDSNNEKKPGFSFAFGPGYRLPLKNTKFIQLSAAYNYFQYNKFLNYTWFTFRAAVGFSWRKTNKVLKG